MFRIGSGDTRRIPRHQRIDFDFHNQVLINRPVTRLQFRFPLSELM